MNQKVGNINMQGFHACILLAQVYTGYLDIRFSDDLSKLLKLCNRNKCTIKRGPSFDGLRGYD